MAGDGRTNSELGVGRDARLRSGGARNGGPGAPSDDEGSGATGATEAAEEPARDVAGEGGSGAGALPTGLRGYFGARVAGLRRGFGA